MVFIPYELQHFAMFAPDYGTDRTGNDVASDLYPHKSQSDSAHPLVVPAFN